jgi:hypothetical protein
LNNYTPRYSHWWDNIASALDITIESDPYSFLKSVIDPSNSFWIACEFNGGVMIYKSKLKAALDLIAIGYSCTDTYHIIQLKYEYMISMRRVETGTRIKVAGSKEIEDKVKRATTLYPPTTGAPHRKA